MSNTRYSPESTAQKIIDACQSDDLSTLVSLLKKSHVIYDLHHDKTTYSTYANARSALAKLIERMPDLMDSYNFENQEELLASGLPRLIQILIKQVNYPDYTQKKDSIWTTSGPQIKKLICMYIDKIGINETMPYENTVPLVLACRLDLERSGEIINHIFDKRPSFHEDALSKAISFSYGNIELVKRLLELPDAINHLEKLSQQKPDVNPVLEACLKGNTEIVEYLLTNCPFLKAPLLVNQFLEKVAHEKKPDDKYTKVLQILIDRGLPVTNKDANGNTPLHYACDMKHVAHDDGNNEPNEKMSLNMVKALLEKKADPNSTNNDGRTPLHQLCFGKQAANSLGYCRSHPDKIIELLLQHGARLDIEDAANMQPLELAFQSANTREKMHGSKSLNDYHLSVILKIITSPKFAELGFPRLGTFSHPAHLEKLHSKVLKIDDRPDKLLDKIYSLRPDLVFEHHPRMLPIIAIESTIREQTINQGWNLGKWKDKNSKVTYSMGTRGENEYHKEFLIPTGVSNVLKLIDDIKKMPYPDSINAIDSTLTAIIKELEPRTSKQNLLSTSLTKRDPKTVAFYKSIIDLAKQNIAVPENQMKDDKKNYNKN